MNIMDKFQAKRLGVSEEKYKESEKIAEKIWRTLYCEGKIIDPFMHIKMNIWLLVAEGMFIVAMANLVLLFYNRIYNIGMQESVQFSIVTVAIFWFLVARILIYRHDMKHFHEYVEEIVKCEKKLEKTEERNEKYGEKKFIGPIKKRAFNNEEVVREVIIQTETAGMAMVIAIGDFQYDSEWIVDMDYENYKEYNG